MLFKSIRSKNMQKVSTVALPIFNNFSQKHIRNLDSFKVGDNSAKIAENNNKWGSSTNIIGIV
jgi:hypothetical protein